MAPLPARSVEKNDKDDVDDKAVLLGFSTISLVMNSWEQVKQIPDAGKVVGELIFSKFFELSPGALNLFPFGANSYRVDKRFQAHSKRVVETFDCIVTSMLDFDFCREFLVELGERHATFDGVQPSYFQPLGQAVLWALETALAPKMPCSNAEAYWNMSSGIALVWDVALQDAWTQVIGFLASSMTEGMKGGAPVKTLEGSSKNSSRNENAAEIEALVSVENEEKEGEDDIDVLLEAQEHKLHDFELDPYSITLVMKSWEQIRQISNVEQELGKLVFGEFFTLSPRALLLYPFGPSQVLDDIFEKPLFQSHSKLVAQSLDLVVLSLLDLDHGREYLLELGARHAEFPGVQVRYFAMLGMALLRSLAKALGDDWNPDLETAWTQVVRYLSWYMIQGMHSDDQKGLDRLGASPVENVQVLANKVSTLEM